MPATLPARARSADKSDSACKSDHVDLQFYPAYCYSSSPTWFVWVKLTAYDIHKQLRSRPDSHPARNHDDANNDWTQNQPPLLFYLNHPIQFVQLVGVVVSFEDYFDRFWLFAVDDSSGAIIDVVCKKPEKDEPDLHEGGLRSKKKDVDAEKRYTVMNGLDIGAVVQVKGQITVFRHIRQIRLERIVLIHETSQEVQWIAARTRFQKDVLSRPWQLSTMDQQRLHKRALGENDQQSEQVRKRQKMLRMKAEREKRHAARIAKEWEHEERKRQTYAEEARRAGNHLKH